MPVILVMGISHCESFLAAIQDDLPLLVIGAPHDEPDACLFLYDENAFLCHGDNVDLLYAMAPFHIDIPEDGSLADGTDSVCRVFLADVPDNLVLEEPHAKDDCTENDYKRYHVIEYILLYLNKDATINPTVPQGVPHEKSFCTHAYGNAHLQYACHGAAPKAPRSGKDRRQACHGGALGQGFRHGVQRQDAL